MDVGRTNDNFTFYEGYEGEPEIVLSLPNHEAVHIWEGYFDDIYNTPIRRHLMARVGMGSQEIISK